MFVKPIIATSSTSFTYLPRQETSRNTLGPRAIFSPTHPGRIETRPLPKRPPSEHARCTSTTDTLPLRTLPFLDWP